MAVAVRPLLISNHHIHRFILRGFRLNLNLFNIGVKGGRLFRTIFEAFG